MSRWTPGLENALRSLGYTLDVVSGVLTPCYLTEYRERATPAVWIYDDAQGFHVAVARDLAQQLTQPSTVIPSTMKVPQTAVFAATVTTANKLYEFLEHVADAVTQSQPAARLATPRRVTINAAEATAEQAIGVERYAAQEVAAEIERTPRLISTDMTVLEEAIDRAAVAGAPPMGEVIEVLAKVRKGQDVFRAALLDYWGCACAVTGLATPALLRASHCKPWAVSEPAEKVNRYNGLLLAAHLDAAFDGGYIGFADDGGLLLSPRLGDADITLLGFHPAMRLRRVEEQHRPFLVWHRSHILLR